MLDFDDMISNLTITGFRAFRELRVDPLTRVNLFVGKNNAGKTSILEAAELLAGGGLETLVRNLRRRKEEIISDSEGDEGPELDPSHLFHGHELAPGKSFSIEQTGPGRKRFECRLDKIGPRSNLPIAPEAPALILSHQEAEPARLPLTRSAGISAQSLKYLFFPPPSGVVKYVGTEEIDAFRLGQLWDDLVLTPDEGSVVEALKIINPRVERIAFLGDNRRDARRIFIKLTDAARRLPLGTVGEGFKRLLSLALHLLSARGGYLLVDEIDTGLHHTVMTDMWKLIIETAQRLDVQVLATTHSLDCVRALARVRDRFPDLAPEVMLHRVEDGLPTTVSYDMNEIMISARDHIEVR